MQTPSLPELTELTLPPGKVYERRAALELRAVGDRLVGHCLVFDTRSVDMGGFCELIKPQAVDRAVGDGADIVALYNHNPDHVLGRTPATLQLRRDDRGLAFTLDPAPTQAGREAFELVKRGDVKGASFGFSTLKDSWSRDGETTIRTLLDIAIVEVSLTAFPVYQQTDVSVALRSLHAARSSTSHSIRWLRMKDRLL